MAQRLFTEAANFETSTPEAIGDYVGRPSFGRRAIGLARSEGAGAHARSIAIQLNEP